MRIKAQFQIPKLNLQQYAQQLRRQTVDAVAFGAYEWLDAATADIPTWSGASRATFLQLAKAVGHPFSIGTPARFAPNRFALGIGNSEGSFDAETPGKVTFTYATTLRHLIFNEFNNANLGGDPAVFSRLLEPGPYRFQEKGATAYQRVIINFSLPDPRPFIKIKSKRVR